MGNKIPNITKRLTDAGVVEIILTTLVSVLLFFFTSFFGKDGDEDVSFRILGVCVFSLPYLLSKILALLIWIFVAVRLVLQCERLRLMPVRSKIQLVLIMLLVASNSVFQLFDETMVALLCFLHALFKIGGMYGMRDTVVDCFKAFLFFLMAAIFRIEYFGLVLLYFFVLLFYRTYSLRVFFCSLLGMVMVAWMVFGVCFFFDITDILANHLAGIFNIRFMWVGFGWTDYMWWGIFCVVVFVARISMDSSSYRFDLQTRLNNTMFGLIFWFSLAMEMIYSGSFSKMMIIGGVLSLSSYFSMEESDFSNIMFIVLLSVVISLRTIVSINGENPKFAMPRISIPEIKMPEFQMPDLPEIPKQWKFW